MKRVEDEAAEERASDWAVRRQAGLSPAEEREFQEWRLDPGNFALYAEAEYALSLLGPRESQADQAILADAFVRTEAAAGWRGRERRILRLGGWGLAAAACVALGFWLAVWDVAPAGPSTAVVVQPQVQQLADGSRVELNVQADLQVEFSENTRAVRLLRGEAHFVVAKDVSRPFVVSVGPVQVRAVGTAFNIRYSPDSVAVLVTEGKVRVSEEAAAGDLGKAADLAAGHQAVIPLTIAASDPVVAAMSEDDIRLQTSWRKTRFELTDATLGETVRLFNRRGRTQLVIDGDELRERRISGIFWADDPEKFADLLAATMDIAVEERPDGAIVLKTR